MKIRFLLVLLLLVSSAGVAEKKPLDLELDTSSFYQEKAKDSSWMRDDNYRSPEEQLSSRCEEMSKEIESLKGKPQRRFALEQRYQAECVE